MFQTGIWPLICRLWLYRGSGQQKLAPRAVKAGRSERNVGLREIKRQSCGSSDRGNDELLDLFQKMIE